MEKFGFSSGFIAKIRVLYNDTESILKFNGSLLLSGSREASSRAVLCLGCSMPVFLKWGYAVALQEQRERVEN